MTWNKHPEPDDPETPDIAACPLCGARNPKSSVGALQAGTWQGLVRCEECGTGTTIEWRMTDEEVERRGWV